MAHFCQSDYVLQENTHLHKFSSINSLSRQTLCAAPGALSGENDLGLENQSSV
jgi:hypothetical protein